MHAKDELAQTLVQNIPKNIPIKIIRILSKLEEYADDEPLKFLVVSLKPCPKNLVEEPPYVPCGRVAWKITPEEYKEILSGHLPIPPKWTLGEVLLSYP
jgi:hypothetical protein